MQDNFLILRTEDAKDLPLPQYMTEYAAGMDLYANIHEDITIKKGEIRQILVGIKISLPKGFEAQVRPRSGLALHHGIAMVNAPGTIDADYRGELSVILINHGRQDFLVRRGNRVGQMVIQKVEQVRFQEVEQLDKTVRGDGGFGHTGL